MKVSYLRKFVKHYSGISQFLTHVKILKETSHLPNFVKQVKPSLLLVDSKLVKYVEDLGIYIVPENSIRYRHHERLMLLADNLANYFRILLKNDPKRFREELRRLEIREVGKEPPHHGKPQRCIRYLPRVPLRGASSSRSTCLILHKSCSSRTSRSLQIYSFPPPVYSTEHTLCFCELSILTYRVPYSYL